jgi:pheromone shutdown protein TraB
MTENQHTDGYVTAGRAVGGDSHRPLDRPAHDDDSHSSDGPLPGDDPRLDEAYLRVASETGTGGRVVLVGVTHDHPASRVRARRTVEAVAPAVVALELPPLAMPRYRQYAERGIERADGESDSGESDGSGYDGGEMAAALAASGDARVVGIDAPNWAYWRRLVETLRAREPDRETAVAAIQKTLSVTKHAVTCALGAAVGALTPWSPALETPASHDSSVADPPAAQAADEARQLSRSRALLGALEPPPGQELVDDLREASMASRIDSLRTGGSVVAVVGHAHLEPIHGRLDGG